MAYVKQLKDADTGNAIFPVTHIDAVTNGSGSNVGNLLNAKQDTLVSGTNIKTVNGNSLLGSGNLKIDNIVNYDHESELLQDYSQPHGTIGYAGDDLTWYIFDGNEANWLRLDNVSLQLKTINNVSLLGTGNITIEGGASVPFIRGTQNAATASWTGVAPFSSLVDGQEIVYCLSLASSSNATLNLTLSDNTTTGAKNVYWRGTTRCGTHNPAGAIFRLIYKENFVPSGALTGTKYTGWWQIGDSYYNDTNTINGRHTGASIYKTGSVLVPSYGLCMMNDSGRLEGLVTTAGNGTSKTKNSNGLVLGQMFYSSNTVLANTNVGSDVIYSEYTYGTIDFRYSSNCGTTLTALKPVYIVGTVDEYDGLFYLANTWWTLTIPTSEDGKVYIYVGTAISTSGIVGFTGGHLVYHYKDDGFRLYSYESHTKYISQISTTIVSMKPNTVYCVRSGSGTTWNAITTLSISALNTTGYGVLTNTSGASFPLDNSKVPIYCACFIAGANISISLPSSVKWVNGVMPTIESGEFCELMIMNNIATINKALF